MTEFGFIVRNAFRRRFRAALMIVSIFIAFALFGVLSCFHRALNDGADEGPAGRLVVVNAVNFTQPLPLAYVERVRAVQGAAVVSHASWIGGYYQDPRKLVSAIAVDQDSYLRVYADDLDIDDAGRQAFLHDRTAVLVGEGIAAKMGWTRGQIVPLSSNIFVRSDGAKSWQVRIAGIFKSRRPAATANFLLMNYAYFNETRTFGKDTTSWLVVVPASRAGLHDLSTSIDALFANSSFETSTTSEKSFNNEFSSQYQSLGLVISVVVGAAFVTLLLIVGSTMALNIRERAHEIGVLKTIGFSNRRILRMVLIETTLLSVAGGVGGIVAAALFVVYGHDRLAVVVPGLSFAPSVAFMSLGLSILFGVAVGAVPSIAVCRMPAGSTIGLA